jgi:hypothetical protein
MPIRLRLRQEIVRFRRAVLPFEHLRQADQRAAVAWTGPQHDPVLGLGLFQLALARGDVGQHRVRAGGIAAMRDDLAQPRGRLAQAAARDVGTRLRVVRAHAGAAQSRFPAVAMRGIGGDGPLEQSLGLCTVAATQLHQPQSTQRIGVIGVQLEGCGELLFRFVQPSSLERVEAGATAGRGLVGGRRRRRARLLEPGIDHVVVRVLREIGLIGGYARLHRRQPLQRLTPGAGRRRGAGRVAGQFLKPADAIGPRLLAVGEQLGERHLGARVLRIGLRLPREPVPRRLPSGGRRGQHLIVLDRERIRRLGAVKKGLVALDGIGCPTLLGETPRRGQSRRIDRADLDRALGRTQLLAVGLVLPQLSQRHLGGGLVSLRRLHLCQQRQRIGIAGVDSQQPIEGVARKVGPIMGAPVARLVQQHGRDPARTARRSAGCALGYHDALGHHGSRREQQQRQRRREPDHGISGTPGAALARSLARSLAGRQTRPHIGAPGPAVRRTARLRTARSRTAATAAAPTSISTISATGSPRSSQSGQSHNGSVPTV